MLPRRWVESYQGIRIAVFMRAAVGGLKPGAVTGFRDRGLVSARRLSRRRHHATLPSRADSQAAEALLRASSRVRTES